MERVSFYLSSVVVPGGRDQLRIMSAAQNLVLIGFMGCGKTTVGQRAAEKLTWEFADTDSLIIEQAGRAIPEIFAAEGESGFRARESAVLKSLADGKSRVIATGGGIVTEARNNEVLRQLGFVVWLNASEEAIFDRVSRNKNRPLLQTADPRQTMRDLLKLRRPIYAKLAHLVVETAGLEADEIAYGICESTRHFFRDQKR
ncbi:MAG: shikimate kinase [Verrucomicrobiales bacterium]